MSRCPNSGDGDWNRRKTEKVNELGGMGIVRGN